MHVFKLNHLISMVAAPIIWAAHFVICYVLVSLACGFGWTRFTVLGMDPAELGIVIITLVSLGLLAYTGVTNFEKFRQARGNDAGNADMSAFFSLASLLLCALSTVALVWVAFPTLMLPTCAL